MMTGDDIEQQINYHITTNRGSKARFLIII